MGLEITTNADSFAPIASMALLAILTCFIASLIHKGTKDSIKIITPIIFTVAVNVMVLMYRVLFDTRLVKDENTWHEGGLLISRYMSGDVASIAGHLSSGKEGYAWLVGLIYTVTGPVPFVMIFLNILLTVLLVPTWVQITTIAGRQLGLDEDQVRRSAMIVAYGMVLVPTIVFWSPRVLREIPSMFLIAVTLMFFLRFLTKRRFGSLLMTVIAVLLMMSVRAQIGLGLCAAIVLSLVVLWSRRIQSKIARVVITTPIVMVCVFYTWSLIRSSADLSVENAIRRNRSLTDATSAFAGMEELQHADSVFEIIVFNFPRVLLGPFPHELNFSSVMVLSAVSNMFWISVLLVSVGLLVRQKDLDPKRADWGSVLVISVFSIMLIVALSVTAGNYGLVVRMRLMPLATLLPLAALGFTLLQSSTARATKKARKGRLLGIGRYWVRQKALCEPELSSSI